jgi:hypothetical protein
MKNLIPFMCALIVFGTYSCNSQEKQDPDKTVIIVNDEKPADPQPEPVKVEVSGEEGGKIKIDANGVKIDGKNGGKVDVTDKGVEIEGGKK